jgi:hypothetical protein
MERAVTPELGGSPGSSEGGGAAKQSPSDDPTIGSLNVAWRFAR